MDTFVAAYLLVWLAVLLYVARLGARQRRLLRDLKALQRQLEESERSESPDSRAA